MRMNIPFALYKSWVMLLSIPKRCRHLWKETWCATAVIASKVAHTLIYRLGVSLRWYYFVFSSQLRTVFLVDQVAPPLTDIFRRDRLLTEAICGHIGTEDFADYPKEVVEHLALFLGDALAV